MAVESTPVHRARRTWQLLAFLAAVLVCASAQAQTVCPAGQICIAPKPPQWRNSPNALPPPNGYERAGFTAPDEFCQWYKNNRASASDAARTWVYNPTFTGQYPGTSYGACNCIGGNCNIGVQHELECPRGYAGENIVNSYGFDPHTFLGRDAPSDPAYCRFPLDLVDVEENLGASCGTKCPRGNVGNPVNAGTGNKYLVETDYAGAGAFPLTFTRTFNSARPKTGSIGPGWRGAYDRELSSFSTGTSFQTAHLTRADGRVVRFNLFGSDWTPKSIVTDALQRLTDASGAFSGWLLRVSDGDLSERYDTNGKLASITNREGLTQTITRDAQGRVFAVFDAFGRTLSYSYDANGQVATMTDPEGGLYTYAYAANRRLERVTYPDGRTRTYHYENSSFPYSVTGITDENGQRFANYAYDSSGKATLSEHAGGTGKVTLSYPSTNASVTDAFSVTRSYAFTVVQGIALRTGTSGLNCPSCGPKVATYDTRGFLASMNDWNDHRTNYAHDARNLETQRVEGLTSSGAATPHTRTINTEWHANFRLPVRVAEPLRITTNIYNGDGGASCGFKADGVTLVPGLLCSKTMQATSDSNGATGFGATVFGAPRTWSYTYNENGSVLSVDGPRSDVADLTTYTYYANDDADPGKRGNVATIANALGHVTSITAYNAHGQPTTIVDANGLTTTLTYDPRLRLTSRSVGGETTTYEYDGVGQLTKVTLPDGSFLSYAYDAAHRLTALQDNLGNRIAYTLDAMGNRTKEEVRDPANTLAKTRTRVISNLNRLFREIGATGQITEYAYDNQGNVTSVKDPLNRVTANAYDALNRLRQVTDPNTGITQYAYNGLDQLTGVTDPRGLATGYAVDGLGNLTQQVSPDTGTTVNTYDAAGNLLTQTDAKGQKASYAYDALNRITFITFADGSKHAYAYDQGANGLGRLTTITETNPANVVTSQIAYGHDPHGRVVSETRSLAGSSFTTGYQYDAAGRMSAITYPSGRTVSYAFDALGRISALSTSQGMTSQVVVQDVQYHPFGGVKSYALGNGQTYARAFDLDGRIASYTLGGQSFAIGYDAASRIDFISNVATPANSNSYGYDSLDRLTNASLPGNVFAYSYDAVGNRLSKTVGSATETYTYGTTSNRLASITRAASPPRSVLFDANGSTINDGRNQYTYDARGRMVQATSIVGSTAYQVNALGQRVRKTNAEGDTFFHYDTRGRLIAETGPGGATKREYLYLGDIPVGVVQ